MNKKLLFILIIVGIFVCLCSCGKQYTITFDPNGADMTTEQIIVEKNEYYALPVPHRVGYEFLGWYDGDEKIESSGTWEIESDLHLVAKWEFLEFEVCCDIDADGKYDKTINYDSNSDTFVIEAPKIDGKIFSHWVDQNGKTYTKNVEIPKGSEGNLYLTAVWWNYVHNDVVYEYNKDTLSVVGYNGKFKYNLTIPSELYGKKVVGIKKGAFENSELITNKIGYVVRITIPQSIEYIEENAFNKCNNIKVMLRVDSTEDYLLTAEKWVQNAKVSPIGNDHLIDVILCKRPAIGATKYVHID